MAAFLTLALVLFQFIAVPSSADAGQLLSYAELMRLPKDQRSAYIQGVRNILIELSKNPDAKFSDVEPGKRSRLRAWLEIVDSQMAQVDASEPSPAAKKCTENPECERALQNCVGNQSIVRWNAASRTYECEKKHKHAKVHRISVISTNQVDSVIREIDIADPQFAPTRAATREPVGEVAPAQVISLTAPKPAPAFDQSGQARPFFAAKPKSFSSITEYSKAAARGQVRGLKCRSKFLPQESSQESVGWESLPACSETQETALQDRFEAQLPPVLKILASDSQPPPEVAPVPAPVPVAAVKPPPLVEAEPVAAQALPVPPPAPAEVRSLRGASQEYGRKIARSEIQPFLDRRENPDKICEQERSVLGDGKLVFAQSAQSEAHGYCMTESGYERFKKGEFDPDRSEASASEGQVVGGEAVVSGTQNPLNAKFAACAPKPQACESRDRIRRQYYQGNLPCVFAGMVSSLANGNRRCQAVTEYKIGDKTLKCDAGQTMCNPMLFGTVLGSNPETPICVGRGQAVTEHCGKISNARDAELFLNRNVSGLQDKWDEFKRGLEDTCKEGSVAAKFHCHECNLMKQRLFELHARLVKNPCETGVDEGVRTRIRDRSAPTAR